MKRLLFILLLVTAGLDAFAAGHRVRGKVVDSDGTPLPGAVVHLDENYLWAVTDAQGGFVLDGVEAGSYRMETECLGYATDVRTLKVAGSIDGLEIVLPEQTLALQEIGRAHV